MAEKNIVVTGATSGIGHEIVTQLSQNNVNLIFTSRTDDKGQTALNDIENVSNSKINYVVIDFGSLESIKKGAMKIRDSFDHLDILINNAGALNAKRKLTSDGFEMTYGVNHLGYFYFTHFLIDLLSKSDSARIINVSSAAHRHVDIDFDDLQAERYSFLKQYQRSKLENLLFTYKLSDILKDTKITVNALHPGFIASQFGKTNNPWYYKLGLALMRPFQINIKEGAETPVYLALSDEVENVTGKYFTNKKELKSNDASYDKKTQDKLWDISLKQCKIEKYGVVS